LLLISVEARRLWQPRLIASTPHLRHVGVYVILTRNKAWRGACQDNAIHAELHLLFLTMSRTLGKWPREVNANLALLLAISWFLVTGKVIVPFIIERVPDGGLIHRRALLFDKDSLKVA
jgi:hypothetical protein